MLELTLILPAVLWASLRRSGFSARLNECVGGHHLHGNQVLVLSVSLLKCPLGTTVRLQKVCRRRNTSSQLKAWTHCILVDRQRLELVVLIPLLKYSNQAREQNCIHLEKLNSKLPSICDTWIECDSCSTTLICTSIQIQPYKRCLKHYILTCVFSYYLSL